MTSSKRLSRIMSWTVLGLTVTMLLAPLSGHAEEQNSNDITRLRHELQVLRKEAETKHMVIARMQERLDALEHRMRAEVQRPTQETLVDLMPALRTERTAQATNRLWGG